MEITRMKIRFRMGIGNVGSPLANTCKPTETSKVYPLQGGGGVRFLGPENCKIATHKKFQSVTSAKLLRRKQKCDQKGTVFGETWIW